jgi:hypothetical protein
MRAGTNAPDGPSSVSRLVTEGEIQLILADASETMKQSMI